MNIYTVILICIAVCYCICRKFVPGEKGNKLFCILTGILLMLVVGLRDWQAVGVDLPRYYNTYKSALTEPFWDVVFVRGGSSFLYYFISSLCAVAGIPYPVFIFACSALFIGTSVYLIYKHSNYPLLGILIYLGMGVFTFQFSGLKQSFAMAFSVLAFDAMSKKKDWWTLLWIAVAVMIHPTAVVLLPLWVATKIRWGKLITLLSLAAVVVVYVLRLEIGELLTFITGDLMKGSYEISGSIGGTAILLIGFLTMYLICFWKDLDTRKESSVQIQAALTFSVMIQICAAFSYSFTRLNLFYVNFLPIIVSEIMNSEGWKRIFGKYEKYAKAAFAAGLGLIMMKQYFSHMHAEALSNFRFLWN